MGHLENGMTASLDAAGEGSNVEVTCFTDVLEDSTVHYQIIRLNKRIYAWIGCNSVKLGPLYAAAPTRPNNTVSVTSILGGTSDNIGSGIARRLVRRTGLNIVVACNLPENNPMLEIDAERKLLEKLVSMGYTKPNQKINHLIYRHSIVTNHVFEVLVASPRWKRFGRHWLVETEAQKIEEERSKRSLRKSPNLLLSLGLHIINS